MDLGDVGQAAETMRSRQGLMFIPIEKQEMKNAFKVRNQAE
jgi:hypothetical protein